MSDPLKIIAAAVVPVVMIAPCGLLCVTFYNRLTTIVARLRAFGRERLHEQEHLESGMSPEAVGRHRRVLALLDAQSERVTNHAYLIQRTLVCLLSAIFCLVSSALLLSLGQMFPVASNVAAVVFSLGLLFVLGSVGFAMRELLIALDPIEAEARAVTELGFAAPLNSPADEAPRDGLSGIAAGD